MTTKKKKGEMITEGISASDFENLQIIYSCEDCTYFMAQIEKCNLGHKTELHRRENQLALYKETGHMRFCRFLEVD